MRDSEIEIQSIRSEGFDESQKKDCKEIEESFSNSQEKKKRIKESQQIGEEGRKLNQKKIRPSGSVGQSAIERDS